MIGQHQYPDSIAKESKEALSYYPELKTVPITIRFKKDIKKSTMLARPVFATIFNPIAKRRYEILISEKFKIAGKAFHTRNIPSDVLIGWIGHELGHIKDYQNRNSFNMIWFGIKYLFSSGYIRKTERAADTYAVNSGMEKFILRTKNYILNNAEIDEKYKSRIRKFYLSPEEIMEIVNERNEKLEITQ